MSKLLKKILSKANQVLSPGLGEKETFGTDFFESQSDIDSAGSSINGAVYINYNVSDEFRVEYESRFNNVSQIAYAGNGYDTIIMLSRAEDSSRESLMKTFKSKT